MLCFCCILLLLFFYLTHIYYLFISLILKRVKLNPGLHPNPNLTPNFNPDSSLILTITATTAH